MWPRLRRRLRRIKKRLAFAGRLRYMNLRMLPSRHFPSRS
ncbi:hypothetical protein USDA257_c13400 [Sinorhizobium fredii USDA 257]|uniref:Uncharacterized protein n=1 Tax=Sinorhizobium fredii (strain USDA 257) TaxID=1185652 RepID=I3X225_SINF2|nr:hypothetical protein USDA257_c13400 [Sinorhizobium fredii USDA 257]